MDDPVKTAEVYTKFLDDIELDFLFGGGISFPVKAFEALGVHNYALAEDDCCIQHLQAELKFMELEDYPALIQDPAKFRSEVYLKRMCPAFRLPKEEAYQKLKDAMEYYRIFL
jgi:hypothetical protein